MQNGSPLSPPTSEFWFPYTKFQPPRPGSAHVARARLQAALAGLVRGHKLTLVAAPAGSGKSLLAASLVQDNPSAAWAALDETDDDLPLFAALLAAALRRRLADEGRGVLQFLQTAPNAHHMPAQLAALLINNLRPAEEEPFILVLDDYHVIANAAVHQLVAHLLDYLPDSLRLVIAARHDPPLPLPRWRARGQLAEVRLPQLRFDAEATAVFLNQRHCLNLAAADVAALHAQTEGWIAGLQLLAAVLGAIEEGGERSEYIQRLAPANRSIFDLLAAEVLGRQPPELQEFLLHTSILPELTPAGCRAVTGNAAAGRLLQDAYQRNLFLRALTLDARDGPFRYHDLFRGFLQQRLREEQPDLWPVLHRRAARAAASDEQKLRHLLSAELWDEAAQLLEEMGQLDMGRRLTRRAVVDGIETLPEPRRLARPWLLLIVGQYYAIRGEVVKAAPWLAQAAARFKELGDELGEIEILAARVMVDALDSAAAVAEFRQKVASAGHLLRPDHWLIYHAAEQWHAVIAHDWPTLTRHTQANMRLALQSGDPGVLAMSGLTIGPHMLFNDEGLAAIEDYALRSLQAAGRDDWMLRICAEGLLGALRFYQGRLEEAEQAGRTAHRLLEEFGGLAWVDHHVCWVVLAALLARRAYGAFDDFLAAQAARWQAQDTAAHYRQGILYLQGRSLWLRNRSGEAQAILEQMQAEAAPAAYDVEDRERGLLLAGMVAMAKGDTGAAKRDLRQAIALHEKVRHTVMLTHPRLTLATLYGRQNRWDEALAELRSVLAELKARGMPGVILQEGESIVPLLAYAVAQGLERETLEPLLGILRPDDSPRPVPLPDSSEHLTPRESEVLRLLAVGLTNPAIAAELSITERTVKAHVTRILAKLGAATRTEAVAKASRLGLV